MKQKLLDCVYKNFIMIYTRANAHSDWSNVKKTAPSPDRQTV